MNTSYSVGGWELRKGDVLLGILTYQTREGDWDIFAFQPARAFAHYQHLFDEWARMIHDPRPEHALISPYDYYDDAILSLNLRLKPLGQPVRDCAFILHIFDAQEAWVQWDENYLTDQGN